MKTLAVLALLVAALPLAAQADVAIAGSGNEDSYRVFLVEVDFGATPQALQLDLTLDVVSGNGGLYATLTDVDGVAADAAGGYEVDQQALATAQLAFSLTTASHTGVRQVMVAVTTTTSGSTDFDGTLACATLSAGDMTLVDEVTLGQNYEPVQFVFDREARYAAASQGAAITREFDVDFGGTPQAVTFFVQAGALGDGTISVFDVTGGAVDQLGSETGAGIWESEDNYTTAARDGMVRLRVRIQPTSSGLFVWRLIFPSSVSVVGNASANDPPKPPSKSISSSGCSTGKGAAWLLLGLPALAALRRRHSRA